MRASFVLPSAGGGGGVHSVVQEAIGLQRFGVAIKVINSGEKLGAFRANYPELETAGIKVVGASSPEELAPELDGEDIACATTFKSAHALRDALKLVKGRKPRPAYYIQDYEPLFCAPETADWRSARSSYAALEEALLFAKTRWLCDLVEANTGLQVAKVSPSIDHSVYFASDQRRKGRIVISAMLRPRTPRRAPHRTARILERIAAAYGDKVELMVFGCADQELDAQGLRLPPETSQRGVLSRREVAAVLRASDLFLDLSDYQAFGRTGLEAMACGCVALLPVFGGATEYAQHWRNAILVDVRSDAAVMSEIDRFVNLSPEELGRMRNAAIATALDYTVDKAAFSEKVLFERHLSAH